MGVVEHKNLETARQENLETLGRRHRKLTAAKERGNRTPPTHQERLTGDLESLPITAFDPRRFGPATGPEGPGHRIAVLRRDQGAPARGFAAAHGTQLRRLETMLGQQLLYRAQHVGPVLTFLRALLRLQQGKLMPQIGDAAIERGRACGVARLVCLVLPS